jgi:hypothetical protein
VSNDGPKALDVAVDATMACAHSTQQVMTLLRALSANYLCCVEEAMALDASANCATYRATKAETP